MPGQDDLHAHFSGALYDGVKIVHLKPQQHAVSVGLVVTIANQAVMVFNFEAVQLKDKLAIPDQLLIFGASMIAPAAQETLIPAAACFHVGYGDEWLRTHFGLAYHISPSTALETNFALCGPPTGRSL